MFIGRDVYVLGRRAEVPEAFGETQEFCRKRGGFAWVGLGEPTEEELQNVAGEFDLHPLAVEDAVEADQRPKLERYGDTLFVVLRPARYLERVEFGEIHVFAGPDFVVTVRHGGTEPFSEVKRRLEADPELLARGPLAMLYAILDHAVDGYGPVLDDLDNDVDEIEAEVFGAGAESEGKSAPKGDVTRRIYGLSREVMLMHRFTRPMVELFDGPLHNSEREADLEVRNYLRDVHDHAVRVNDRTEGLRDLLSNIISINLAIVGAAQTDQTKRISAWAAILIVPTIVTGVYGMNFNFIPELNWRFGYPLALLLIVVVSATLYVGFRHRGWI
ncbi:magnesium and cobalt transport protein CorA [Rubrobacter indicoceani]|uniref:magnesium and cobalt transport protein CorA n=1 Tax=Rubrobacter indicoceani TaxID=2051957 RepID=UPI000E5BEE64|nr:magnesium and cobalt transport protein CorA [Rubrobacter indicoceani]